MDGIIADAIVEHLERGIPADVDIVGAVMRRAADRKPRLMVRSRWALAGAAAAALLAAAVALAIAATNLPARLNLVPAQTDAGPIDKTGGAASPGAADQGQPTKVGPRGTTLAAAGQAFGAHILTPGAASDAVLDAVYFAAATPLPSSAKPGSPASRDTVELVYTYGGTHVDITEVLDATTTPLTVDALDQGGAKLKAAQGLGAAAIETVDGSDYVVGRSASGSDVEWIIWKSATGVVVTVHLAPGLAHDAAFALVATIQ